MSFGLKNAHSVFQRAVLKTLGSLSHSFVNVYMEQELDVTVINVSIIIVVIIKIVDEL